MMVVMLMCTDIGSQIHENEIRRFVIGTKRQGIPHWRRESKARTYVHAPDSRRVHLSTDYDT